MRTKTLILSAVLTVLGSFSVQAETSKEMCLRVSEDWSSTGDVASQCNCVAGIVEGDASLKDEFFSLETNFTNDTDAYEGSSDAMKAAFDQCDVET